MFEVEVGLELAEVGQSFAAGGLSQTAAADLLGTAVLGRTAAVAVLLFAGSQKFAQRRTETVAVDQIVAVVAVGQTASFGIEEESAVAAVTGAADTVISSSLAGMIMANVNNFEKAQNPKGGFFEDRKIVHYW